MVGEPFCLENRKASILGSAWFEEGAHNRIFSLLDLMTSYIKGPEYCLGCLHFVLSPIR
jgi:hypothetical protein